MVHQLKKSVKDYAVIVKNKIDPNVIVKFDSNKKLDGVKRKKLNISLASNYGWKTKMNFSKALDKTIDNFKRYHK